MVRYDVSIWASSSDLRRRSEDPNRASSRSWSTLYDAPRGTLLFDTGIGAANERTEAHYRPHRRDLSEALAAAGVTPAEISLVVNCHLHFDHCGGNHLLPGRPIFAQAAELAAARTPGYTVPELVDFPGADYRP